MVLFRFEREISEEQSKLLQIVVELNQTTFDEYIWQAISDAVAADFESADSLPLAQKWDPEVKEEETNA